MNKTRELQLSNNRPWYTKLFRWETLLAIILVLVCLGLKIMDKTTPRLIQFHTLKNAVNPPFLGGFLISGTVAA